MELFQRKTKGKPLILGDASKKVKLYSREFGAPSWVVSQLFALRKNQEVPQQRNHTQGTHSTPVQGQATPILLQAPRVTKEVFFSALWLGIGQHLLSSGQEKQHGACRRSLVTCRKAGSSALVQRRHGPRPAGIFEGSQAMDPTWGISWVTQVCVKTGDPQKQDSLKGFPFKSGVCLFRGANPPIHTQGLAGLLGAESKLAAPFSEKPCAPWPSLGSLRATAWVAPRFFCWELG